MLSSIIQLQEEISTKRNETGDLNPVQQGFFAITREMFKLLNIPRSTYFIPFILSLFRSAVLLATPFYFKILLDMIQSPQEFSSFQQILWILIFLNISGFILNVLTQRSFQHLGISTIFELRNKIFAHLQRLSLNYHHQNKTGDIIAFITNDAENVNGLISSALINIVLAAIQLIGSLIFMVYLSWQMSLILLITMPILFFISRYFSFQAHLRAEKERKAVNEITAQTQEIMDGLRTIRDLRMKPQVEEKFQEWVQKEVEGRFYAQKLWSIMIPFNNFFSYMSIGLVVLLGAYLAMNNVISLGTIFAFILYFQQFGGPLQQIASFFSDIQRALVGGRHILELLQIESEIKESPTPIEYNDTQGDIEFHNVNFAYDKEVILHNLSIKIQSKQRIAIVGPTGAGKTTFASLIPRFYDIKNGEILIDGKNVKEYTLKTLRGNIGLVLQDPFLFNESVKDNIRFGRWDASDTEIFTITQKIGIHDFISQLPHGYETKVGERGTILSVGQCQLIAIARTLLNNPTILILDEATSSVDAYSELQIQRALDELLKNRTCIIIAHRFSTIHSADKILVMEYGQIVQQGTHKELIQQPGLYSKYYKMQFAEREIN